jgi:hypothetical protein
MVNTNHSPSEINLKGIVMNRIAVRISSAALAVAATLSVLQGIAMLADVEKSARLPVVVLPRVEVIATARHDSPVELANIHAEGNPQ